MRKTAYFLALLATAAPLSSLTGCQMFTAGEQVSEPDPVQVRAKSAQKTQAKAEANKAKQAHGLADQGAAAETATASHILIRYAGAMRAGADITRSKEDARKYAEEIAQKAQAPGADFGALAREYTEEPSGKEREGKLGTFGRGRMVPEFEKAVFGLEPGGVSGVIESAFGFHIIYREK